ncbi:fibroleukin-like [Saccostrea echinata]|uniref:fibroleukin-like n=1 Tax=Saccostrea echinata TaxID=191078 RepID=UPI002A835376|nr:fibroleukin-like [Saccostrea echinata]
MNYHDCIICLNVFFFTWSQATNVSWNYTAKLDFDNKKFNDELLGEYNAQSTCVCSAMCQEDCGVFGYNPKLKKCRVHTQFNCTSEMSDEAGWRYYFDKFLPMDCKDVRDNGHTSSGVYEIYPFGARSCPVRVYCDMETMDGGWTVIQNRKDGSLNFQRSWKEYKNGFGEPGQNVWIGNNLIHQLTKGKKSYLYVSITLENGTTLYELYERFSISDEGEKYKLFLAGDATGTLGDRMLNPGHPALVLSGMYFSTPNRDNDPWDISHCALKYRGGWWFNTCHNAFLNGPWADRYYWIKPWYPPIYYSTDVNGTMMMIKRH